nr:hypothetical protein [Tanacetum cinerariifolium]
MLKLQGLWSRWDECPKKIISDALKNLKTPRQADRRVHKQGGLARQEVSTFNPFDALNTAEKDDELGTNEGKSKLVEKGAKSDVVSLAHETSFEAFDDDEKLLEKEEFVIGVLVLLGWTIGRFG